MVAASAKGGDEVGAAAATRVEVHQPLLDHLVCPQ